MILVYIFILSIFFSHAKVNNRYKEIIDKTTIENYEKSIKEFENIKKDNDEYKYFYACLQEKIMFLNLLSDRVDFFVDKTYDALKDLEECKKRKYVNYAKNKLISIHNYFLERGCEYLKVKEYDKSIKNLEYAKLFYYDPKIDIKIGFIYIQKKQFREAIQICDETEERLNKQKIKNKKDVLYDIKINKIKALKEIKDFEKVVEEIKNIIDKNPFDVQILEVINEIKNEDKVEIDQLLSSKKDIKLFQDAALLYFDEDFEHTYEILKNIKIKNTEQQKLLADTIYKYCLEIQKDQKNTNILRKLIKEDIKIHRKILRGDNKNTKILNRLYALYKSINDDKNAQSLAKTYKMDLNSQK